MKRNKAWPGAVAGRIRQIMADMGDISERELARRAGLAAETHVNQLVKRLESGSESVDLLTVLKLAIAAGRSLHWLATGREEQTGFLLREVHGWREAEAECRQRFPEVPDFAFTAISGSRWPETPARLDAVALRDMARAWLDMMGPDARRRAEREHVLGA